MFWDTMDVNLIDVLTLTFNDLYTQQILSITLKTFVHRVLISIYCGFGSYYLLFPSLFHLVILSLEFFIRDFIGMLGLFLKGL